MTLTNIIIAGYAENIPHHATVHIAAINGFIVSEALVRLAYQEHADHQWLDLYKDDLPSMNEAICF